MEFYIVSASQHPDLTPEILGAMADALEFQLYQHAAPLWQSAGCKVRPLHDIKSLPKYDGVTPIVIYDEPDQAGVLGWHTYGSDEGIYGTVFVNPIIANGGSISDGANAVSVTLSHEVLEAWADPYVNLLALMDDGRLEPVEACDRTQGDSYKIGDISVSNFLGPRAFRSGSGPYDYMRLLREPWEVRPNGYCVRYNAAIDQGETIWGEQFPQWKRDLVEAKLSTKLSRLGIRARRNARIIKEG